ncbi:MAG: DUF4416 family protein [Deltaproteobacteria bacterium]|nr:DUF4416 family protein [Deltaproteobacteria bacterium]
MGIPKEPAPVKCFVALLSSSGKNLASVERDLTALLGPIDSRSPGLPWEVTDYYAEEMGRELTRIFFSFLPLISPEMLAPIKLKTQALENDHARLEDVRKRRTVNIDPGYLDVGKITLASTKYAGHRLYLNSGIYGEVTLLYYRGAFHPFDYTYPDYLWPDTLSFFAAMRALYLTQLKPAA